MFNGFNIRELGKNNQVPPVFQEMGISSSLVFNFNIMLFAMIFLFAVFLVIYSMGRICESKALEKGGEVLMKQGILSLVLFNTLNIFFAAGVYFKYNHQ